MAEDWQEVKSKSRDSVYYYNRKTGESVWQVPTKKQEHENEEDVTRVSQTKESCQKKNPPPRIDKVAVDRIVRAQLRQNSSSRPCSQNSVYGERTEAPPSIQMENCEPESMEVEKWEEDEEVAMDIDMDQASVIEMFDSLRDTRASFQIESNMKEWYGIPLETSRVDLSNQLYMVLDTNVLLSHLKFLNELKDSSIKGVGRPVLVIPWVVLQELDVLKKCAPSVSLKATKAITFLNDCFTTRHPRVVGQSLEEVHTAVQCFDIDTNDDRILHCCLVYKQKTVNTDKVVLLFTNDTNLCSKALVCNVAVGNRKTLLGQLRELARSCTTHDSSRSTQSESSHSSQGPSPQPAPAELGTVEENRHKSLADSLLGQSEMILRETLSIVIKRAMNEAYGDLGDTIVARKPPWSLDDTFFLLDRHWVAVFQFEVIGNQSSSCQDIKTLQQHRLRRNKFVPTMESVRQLVQPAVKFLRSLNAKHNQFVVESVKRLNAILSQAMPHSTAVSPSPTPIPIMPHTPTGPFPPRGVLSPSSTDLMQYSFSQSSSLYETLRNALELVHESVNLACNGATGRVDWNTHMRLLRELILTLERILAGGANMLTAPALHSSMQQYLYHVLQLTLPFTPEQLMMMCANPETIVLLSSAMSTLLSYQSCL